MIAVFIIGIIFGILIIPLLQVTGDVLITYAEYIKSKINVKIVKNNKATDELINGENCENVHVVGFEAGNEEDYEEDYEEEDAEQKHKAVNTIGFVGISSNSQDDTLQGGL